MARATILGAEDMERPRHRRLAPNGRIPVRTGYNIFLHAEGRHVKTVDDVLGGADEPDLLTDRNMKLIDLALSFGMLEFPHPLLTDDVDVHRVVWNRVLIEKDF